MTTVATGTTIIDNIVHFTKTILYSCGKMVQRVYNKATGELVDAIPLPKCHDFDRFAKHMRHEG